VSSAARTVYEQAGEDGLGAVRFSTRLARLARVAHINKWLEAGSLPDFELLHALSNLDNHTGALVACALGPEDRHLGQIEVIQHKVHVTEAKARGVQLNQDVLRPCQRPTLVGFCFRKSRDNAPEVDQPGSGTGSFWTSTWKSGPSLTTTAPTHSLGISNEGACSVMAGIADGEFKF